MSVVSVIVISYLGRWDDPLVLYANLLHDFALYSKTLQAVLIPL